MSQVVLNAIEADTAGGALVVVTKRQRRENTATAVPWNFSQTGPLAQVNWAISFGAGAACSTGRNFLLHGQAQNGGRWGRGSSTGSSGGSCSISQGFSSGHMNLIHLLPLACADGLGKEGCCGGCLGHMYGSLVGWVMAGRTVEAFVNSIVIMAAETDVAGLTEGSIRIVL